MATDISTKKAYKLIEAFGSELHTETIIPESFTMILFQYSKSEFETG